MIIFFYNLLSKDNLKKLQLVRTTFADRVIAFNKNLNYSGKLPEGFDILNPFSDNPETAIVMQQFYKMYYNDNKKRKFIIGINPSRHGAGVTGVPFTDTKRLESVCKIKMQSAHTHEVSSVFMYDMIQSYGGVKLFYSDFYINSPFPLAIVRRKNNTWLNANYYDDATLFLTLKDYMIETLKNHISLGLITSEVFILGKKNALFISEINKVTKLFKKMTVLDHPRFIQQYRLKEKLIYINKYLSAFRNAE